MTKFRVTVYFKTTTPDASYSSVQHTSASFDVVSYGNSFDDPAYEVKSVLSAQGIDLDTIANVYIARA